jgi:hypothetical protein
LGSIEAVLVFNPFSTGTSAFQVIGTNTVLIGFTNGSSVLAQNAQTSCTITMVNGQPVTPFTFDALIVPQPGVSGCAPASGALSAVFTPPNSLTGTISGSIRGNYAATILSTSPTVPITPSVIHYEASSVVHTTVGDLQLSEAGSVNVGLSSVPLATLWTVLSGTGSFQNAFGTLMLTGNLNSANNLSASLSYSGTLCTP